MSELGFIYHFKHYDKNGNLVDAWSEKNLLPNVGRDYLMAAGLSAGPQLSAWYIGLYQTNYSPVSTETMTTLLANTTENTAYETTANQRIPLVGALESGTFSNVLSAAEFTFTANASIYGAFITSGASRSSTTGTLISVEKNPTAKPFEAGETLTVIGGISFNTSI